MDWIRAEHGKINEEILGKNIIRVHCQNKKLINKIKRHENY